MFKSDVSFILNSRNELFTFELTVGNRIMYNIYDSHLNFVESSLVNAENILKYSILIGEDDVIHLIALASSGELIYFIYDNVNWSKSTIAKFDLRSNIYNQFEILKIKDEIHIVYNYSNLINSNIWTIQHVVLGSNERHNAIRYISKKIPEPFTIDVDSLGNIHLLYMTYGNNNSQIHHGFYNPYTKAWVPSPKRISLDDTNNIYPLLLIDLKDNLQGVWLEENKGQYKLKYMKMNSRGKERFIWNEKKLPYKSVSKYPPVILEEKYILKLYFQDKNSIISFKSSDYGDNWTKDGNFDISSDLILTKVSSNLRTDINKIKRGYSNLSPNPKLYFFENYFNKADIQIPDEVGIDTREPDLEPTTMDTEPEVSNDINAKLDEIVENQNSINIIIKDIIIAQEDIYNRLNNLENLINENKRSFFSKLFS